MLKNAKYIMENILIADGVNTSLAYCQPAQVGVDLTVKNILNIDNQGIIYKDKTIAPQYTKLECEKYMKKKNLPNGDIVDDREVEMFFIPQGTYILELNEGCNFGPNDTGYIILRSSLNRSGVSVQSAVWDPGYCSKDGDVVNTMSVRLTVDTPKGVHIEKNARVAQLLVFENENTSLYDGQWQGGRKTSKIN